MNFPLLGKWLLAAAAVAGLAVDLLGRWTSIWSLLISVVVMGLLIAALFKAGRSAPFWNGFALAGWTALLLGWIGSERGTWLVLQLDNLLTPPGKHIKCLTCHLEIAGDHFHSLWGGATLACAAAGGWAAKRLGRASGAEALSTASATRARPS